MYEQRAHFLRRNESNAVPDRHVIFDTETRGRALGDGLTVHELRLGTALFWQRPATKQPERLEWKDFTHAAAFWEWLDRRAVNGKRVVVWAHNIGFDLQVLEGFRWLESLGYELRKSVVDADRIIVSARRDRATLLFLDWFNFWHGSIRDLADKLGTTYLELPEEEEDDRIWAARARSDVSILHRGVARWLELVETEELGYFGMTLPSQAMHAYRHGRAPRDLALHKDPAALELEYESYMGARVEAFRFGVAPPGRWTLFDVNSAYGAVMYEGIFPKARVGAWSPDMGRLSDLLRTRLVVARVLLRTEEPLYPVRLPQGLCWPVGEFWTTLTTPELKVALERGHIVKVKADAQVYEGSPIFKRYIADLWQMRSRALERGDEYVARMTKDLIVSLFGKFGQRVVRWKHVADEPGLPDELWSEHDMDARHEFTFRRMAGRLEERLREEPGWDSFPAISAHVTAEARLHLQGYMDVAERAHIAYVDTDALIVDDVARERLMPYVKPLELGMLKLEAEGDELVIDGAKVYRLGSRVRHKGKSRKARDKGGGVYEQEQFVSLPQALRNGVLPGAQVRTVRRTHRPSYTKGVVLEDGTVRPLRLPDDAGPRG